MKALAFVVEETRQAAENAIRDIFSAGNGEIPVHILSRDNAVKDYPLMD